MAIQPISAGRAPIIWSAVDQAFRIINQNFSELAENGVAADTGDIAFDATAIIGNQTNESFPQGSIQLIPNAGEFDPLNPEFGNYIDRGMYLDVYPTTSFDEPHIHIAAGKGSLSTGDLFLGDDTQYIKISNYGTVEVKTKNLITGQSHNWFFGEDGALYGPAEGTVIAGGGIMAREGNELTLSGGQSSTFTTQFQIASGTPTVLTINVLDFANAVLIPENSILYWNNDGIIESAYVTASGAGLPDTWVLTLLEGSSTSFTTETTFTASWIGEDTHGVTINANASNWDFQPDGTIVFPDSTVQSTAWTGAATSVSSRTQVSATTTNLLVGDTENITIAGFKGYVLYKIQTSAAAWVRVYTDVDSRTADADRSELTDPAPGAGVIAEVITTGPQTILISPGTFGFSNETIPDSNIQIAVTNKSNMVSAITVTLTVVQLEA